MTLHQKYLLAVAGGIAASALVAACGGSTRATVPSALTEYDFALDPALRLQPGQVGLTFLEAMDAAPDGVADTGTLGVDEIPFLVAESQARDYAIDPAVLDGTVSRVEIRGPDGALVLALTADAPSSRSTLAPGAYTAVIVSGYPSADGMDGLARVVFVKPPSGSGAAALQEIPAVTIPLEFVGRICRGCDLEDAHLERANLTGADLTEANLADASLDRARLERTDLTGASLVRASLFRANLRYATFEGADLTDADLTEAYVYNVRAAGSVLARANLVKAVLVLADLPRSNLRRATAFQADFMQANLAGSDLEGIQMTYAGAAQADFSGARLRSAIMSFAYLRLARFGGADLTAARLTEAHLVRADLSGADLTGADLEGANLTGAVLTGAVLTDANFSGATWTDGQRICATPSIGECK